jgi:hypothetical protein
MDTDADMVKAPHWTGKTWLIGELERPAELFSIRTTIMKVHAWMARIWTALAACRGEAQRRLERQRRQRFSYNKELPKAAWRFASRRSPKLVAAASAALDSSVLIRG